MSEEETAGKIEEAVMRLKIENTYFKWGLTGFITISACIVVFFIIFRSEGLAQSLSVLLAIVTPFIYGFVIAYLLTPIYNFFMRRCHSIFASRIKNNHKMICFSKAISTTITLIITFFVTAGLISLVLPQLFTSILGIINTFPSNADGLMIWLTDNFNLSSRTANFINNNVIDNLTNWFMDNLVPSMSEVVEGVSIGVLSFLVVIKNFLIGLIISVYLLNSKETFGAQSKKIIFASCNKSRAEFLINETKFINKTFSGFINGKIIDSIIIGIITFIVLSIMNMPYTLLISVVIGVTNIIPFFGPFIGAIPATIIILLESPMQAVYFVIFILILQQIDGNVIGPKILGGSTGIPSFWVIFAILVGGGLFGFPGMIVGIPVFAVIYAYTGRYVRSRLNKKELPADTCHYKDTSSYRCKKKKLNKKKGNEKDDGNEDQ